jgi:ClpP class serine protease
MRERLKRLKRVAPSEERLINEAEQAREKAKTLPSGKEQDALVRSARQSETAARIDLWINSPGLQPPK